MGFYESEGVGLREVTGRAPEPRQADRDFISAAFNLENPVLSLVRRLREEAYPSDPNHNPIDYILGTKYEERYPDRFTHSQSEAETRAIMSRIDQEQRDRESVEAAGWAGTVAGIAAGVLDPTLALPGGALVRGVRGGYSAARSAAVTGAAAAGQAAVSESVLQGTQETRTPMESALGIGSATILGGLFGGGAAALLTRAERQTMIAALDKVRADMDAHAGNTVPAPAGAAATDTRQLTMQPSIPGTRQMSPTRDVLESKSVVARRAMADTAETPYSYRESETGQAVTRDNPPIDRMMKMAVDGLGYERQAEWERLWLEHRYGADVPALAKMRTGIADFMGAEREAGKLSWAEFDQQVGVAMMNGDRHEIPQVAQAAQFARKQMEPWLKLAEEHIPDFKALTPAGGESYFPHIWNREKHKQLGPEAANRFVELYKADQAKKAAARDRLAWSGAQLASWNDQVRKLEARLERLDASREKLSARFSERSMEVRRAENRTGTLEERAGSIAEQISEIEEFIAEMRPQLRDPDMLARLDEMEKEARALRAADRPMTEAQLRKVEQDELSGILQTPEVRMASEIVTGRRKPPERPNFVKWLVKSGGIEDPGGDVAAMVGGPNVVRGLIRKEGPKFAGMGGDKRQGFQEIAEQIAEANPGMFRNGPPTRDDILGWIGDSQRGIEPEWLTSLSRDTPEYRADALAQALEEAIGRSGADVKGVRDVAKILRDERSAPMTLDDLDRVVRDMEAAGQETPMSVRAAAAEDRLQAGRQGVADLRAVIDRAKRARDAEARRLFQADARTGEAEFGRRQNVGRLGVLDERLDAADRRRELIVDALEMADRQRAELRAKIETEIGAWEGKSTQEAKTALKAREKYEKDAVAAGKRGPDSPRLTSADDAIDRTVKRIVDSDRDLTDQELRDIAWQTVNRIKGSPDGRLPYDLHSSGGPRVGVQQGPPPRGPLAGRQLNVSNEWAKDWIEPSATHAIRSWFRTVVPDVLLTMRHGDPEMSQTFRAIQEDYARLEDATKPGSKERKELTDERDRVLLKMAGVRDRIRGVYGWAPGAENLGRITTAIKQVNNITNLGMAAVASIADFAGAPIRYGLMSTFQNGWQPFFRHISKPNDEIGTKFRGQWRALGLGIDTAMNMRQHAFDDMMDGYRPTSRVERGLTWANDKFFVANLLAPETDMQKFIVANVASHEILRIAKAAAAGKATRKEIGQLADAGIDQQMAGRINREFFDNKLGEVVDGVYLPNTADWGDKAAAAKFNAAVLREADIAVITPGQEKPLFMSKQIGSLLSQFKSFTAAASERALIANIQKRDARVIPGLMFSVGLGMLSYKINSMLGGQKTSDRPQDWIKEGVNRSGITGWFEEGNAMAAKLTGGALDVHRLYGADKPLSRFASRSLADTFLGPTAGKLANVGKVGRAAASGEWEEGDTTALRRLMFLQNLLYLRGAFNQIEQGANNAFGIEMKAKP